MGNSIKVSWLLALALNPWIAAGAPSERCPLSADSAYSCHLKPHDNFHDYKNWAWHSDNPDNTFDLKSHEDCRALCAGVATPGFCHSLMHMDGNDGKRWLCSFQDLAQCNDEPKRTPVDSRSANQQFAGRCD